MRWEAVAIIRGGERFLSAAVLQPTGRSGFGRHLVSRVYQLPSLTDLSALLPQLIALNCTITLLERL